MPRWEEIVSVSSLKVVITFCSTDPDLSWAAKHSIITDIADQFVVSSIAKHRVIVKHRVITRTSIQVILELT